MIETAMKLIVKNTIKIRFFNINLRYTLLIKILARLFYLHICIKKFLSVKSGRFLVFRIIEDFYL